MTFTPAEARSRKLAAAPYRNADVVYFTTVMKTILLLWSFTYRPTCLRSWTVGFTVEQRSQLPTHEKGADAASLRTSEIPSWSVHRFPRFYCWLFWSVGRGEVGLRI